MTQLLLYLPAIHAGYQGFLEQHAGADVEVLLVGRSFAPDYPVIRKEIRALDPAQALRYLTATGLVTHGRVVEEDDIRESVGPGLLLVADEDLLRDLVASYRLEDLAEVRYLATFLRWDREWSRAGLPPSWDGRVTADEYARMMQRLAASAAGRSSDWWRRVGAVAVRGQTILAVEHNRHLPTEYAPYIDGDPRNNFRRGIEMELTTAIHAEAAIISRAAREGFSLAGADLHVGTFPCPGCARLIAEVGFGKCFFAGGYSVLAGDDVMRAAGVELCYVDTGTAEQPAPSLGAVGASPAAGP
jgi:dCMP deaminase